MIAGGPYDDKIFTGSNILGAPIRDGITVLVYGDKDDLGGLADAPTPDSNDMLPLEEYPDTFNKYDGNDLIDVGDNITGLVHVYGQGGNDKIIGGYGEAQIDHLWGGSGDDRIWMVNPNQVDLDVFPKS